MVRGGEAVFNERIITTRWTTYVSPEVNLAGAMDFTTACGASMVTLPADIRANATLNVQRVEPFLLYSIEAGHSQ